MTAKTTKTSTPAVESIESPQTTNPSRTSILLTAIDLIALCRTINLPEYYLHDAVGFGAASEGRWYILLHHRQDSVRDTTFTILFAHTRDDIEDMLNKHCHPKDRVRFMQVHHTTGVWAVLVESSRV